MKAFVEVCKFNIADVVTTSPDPTCPTYIPVPCTGCNDD